MTQRRWREGSDPELRALLRHYERQEAPSSERVEALAARVVAGLAVVTAGAAGTAASASAATASGITAAGAGVSTGAAAGTVAGAGATAGVAGAGAAVGASGSVAAGTAAWLSLTPASIWVTGVAVAAIGGASLLIAQQTREQPQLRPSTVQAPILVKPVKARAPAQAPPTAEPAPAEVADAGIAREALAPAAAAPRPARAATRAPHVDTNPEVGLLQRARQVLAREPAAALALLELHQRDYPEGVFAEEREALAIDALRRVGLNEQAELRAQRFEQRYPDSAYRERVQALRVPSRPR